MCYEESAKQSRKSWLEEVINSLEQFENTDPEPNTGPVPEDEEKRDELSIIHEQVRLMRYAILELYRDKNQ